MLEAEEAGRGAEVLEEWLEPSEGTVLVALAGAGEALLMVFPPPAAGGGAGELCCELLSFCPGRCDESSLSASGTTSLM